MPAELPTHKNEQTGNAPLDRIQNNVRQIVQFLRDIFWVTKRAYVQLTEDTTLAAAASFATLLTGDLASSQDKSFLLIDFHMSGSRITNLGTTSFRFVVDDVATKGFSQTIALNSTFSGSFQYRIPITRGVHRVLAQWVTDANSTQIRARTVVNEYATLHLSEEV